MITISVVGDALSRMVLFTPCEISSHEGIFVYSSVDTTCQSVSATEQPQFVGEAV